MNEARSAPGWYWTAVATLVLCAGLWSLNGPLIKLLANTGASGLAIAFYRSIIGGLVLMPFAVRHAPTLRNARPGWPIASVALFTIMTASFVIATTRTAAANAIVLQYTSPLWVFALSPILLHERPRWSEGAALLIAMAGVGAIFLGHATTELPALLMALTSGFGYGVLTITLRGLRRVAPVVVTCMNCTGSGVILGVWLAAVGTFALTSQQAALIVLLSLVQFTLPYVLFSWALRIVEAHRAALIVLLECVLNPLWTFLIVSEWPPGPTLIGGPLILAGVGTWMVLAKARGRIVPVQEASSGRRDVGR